MSKVFFTISIYLILFVGLSTAIAEDTLVFSDSNKPILQAMELSLKSNSLSYLYALQSSNDNLTYKGNKQSDSLKLKNPNTALFYAAVPGFIVRGAGHFYAGKTVTGAILLSIDIASFGLAYCSMVRGLGEMESGDSDTPELLAFGAVTLFIGSWIYDLIFAPLSVVHQNERILQRKADNLSFKLRI